jgi:hypothetical protein
MEEITEAGQKVANDLARQYGFSPDAVTHMMQTMWRGRGAMAQFDHPEFAGSGQWMRGGMLMISDMFNNSLKARVDGLCQAIAAQLSSQPFQPAGVGSFQAQSGGGDAPLFVPDPRDTWWPAELGAPSAVGSQNGMSYAFFPAVGRLAIQSNGQVSLYDTGHHQIAGFSQQQGSGGAVVFATPGGSVSLSSLSSMAGGTQQQSGHGGSQQQNNFGGSQQQSSATASMAAMAMQPMQPMAMQPMQPMAGFESWWPAELGSPSATGAQNSLRYAWFADSGCLAVQQEGALSLLDARQHPINGIAQASGSAEVVFSTPGGTVSLSSLPPFSPPDPPASVPTAPAASAAPAGPAPISSGDVISALERLGELKAKGVLSEAEFSEKKTELLSRL